MEPIAEPWFHPRPPGSVPARKIINNKGEFGGRTWARTKDPLIKSQLLYQLSYASVLGGRISRIAGSDPYSDSCAREKGKRGTA